MDIKGIVTGHVSELLGLNKSLSSGRLQICRECPLYKPTIAGAICNNKLWYNPETGEISNTKKDNYIRGCGCRLAAKTTIPYMTCPVGKW